MRRLLLAAGLAVGSLVALAGPAAAHASFVAATPAAGHGFPQAPGAVALRFSEPLHRRLSHIDVLDARGRDVGLGHTVAVENDPLAMRRRLGPLGPGQYRVRWVSVSTVDGHTLRGSYNFGVGTFATGDEQQQNGPIDSEGWLGLAGRWVALGGLGLWVGSVVLGPVARRGGLGAARLAGIARLAPALALVGTAVSVASTAVVSAGSLSQMGQVLSGGQSGQLRALTLAAALAGSLMPQRFREAQAGLVALAILGEAGSGHAAASLAPGIATVSFALHLTAVGVWVFAIAGALLAPGTRRFLAAVWPHAVAAAAVVVVTGILNASFELTAPGDLTSTGYGRTVALKVALLVTMAGLGVTHQLRRRRPETSEPALRRPVRLELVAGGLALGVAALLVSFPNPPRDVASAEQAEGNDPVLVDLASYDALSLAEASGPFVVGITVLPPRLGPVEMRVQVVGLEAGDGIGDARLALAGPGGAAATVALDGCGAGCFKGPARIDTAGPWSFAFSARSARGALGATLAAPLPAPDGRATFASAVARFEQLRSLRMEEDLRARPGGDPLVARYGFGPGAFSISVGGRDQVVIGQASYDRPKPAAPWSATPWPGPAFRWPSGYYRLVWNRPAAVRLLGTDQVDGRAMQVISFVRPDLPAWFRLWVGVDDGLVHREQMRAEGHLMDRTYSDFDAAPPITAPALG